MQAARVSEPWPVGRINPKPKRKTSVELALRREGGRLLGSKAEAKDKCRNWLEGLRDSEIDQKTNGIDQQTNELQTPALLLGSKASETGLGSGLGPPSFGARARTPKFRNLSFKPGFGTPCVGS